MNTGTVRWIFFDIGGVIGDESRFTKWRLSNDLAIIQKYCPEFTYNDLMRLFPEASAIVGSIDVNLIQLALQDSCLQEKAKEDLRLSRRMAPDYYDWLEIRGEAREVLEILSRKYKLGIMANQHHRIRERLQEENILRYFAHAQVSGDYRIEKPSLDFFWNILEATGANPRESVMIDDNIERGIIPAKSLGMTTIWYRLQEWASVRSQACDFEITALREILGIYW